MMKSICVYLGAKCGNHPNLNQVATDLGHAIAKAGYRLVYGGSSQGLMGLLAKGAMTQGGKVTGIIPQQLITQEKPFKTLDELVITDSMQERKRLMEQRADGFIVMPGGLGTLEEAFETWNAIKIGIINKPLGFLNINGFFDGLFSFIEHCVDHEFVSAAQAKIPKIHTNPQLLLTELMQPRHLATQEALV